jgi:hypothetical protein
MTFWTGFASTSIARGANYQTLVNEALRSFMLHQKQESLETTLDG